MSDERITDPADTADGLPDPATDPTARLLRDVLARTADDVRPAPDGLARIRAAIETDRPRGRLRLLTRRGPARPPRPWLPAMAAAASVVLLAGVAGVAGTLLDRLPAQQPAVLGSGPATASRSAPALPVYRVGSVQDQDGRVEYGLFREFHSTVLTDLDARLSEAVTEAVTARPEDPDYLRVFGGGGGARVQARWDEAAQEVQVVLTPAMITVRNATDARARSGVQQIVWTATAVLSQSRAGSADAPVRISVSGSPLNPFMFGRPTFPLGGQFFRGHSADDPLAPVWIVDPRDGDQLGKQMSTFGISAGYTARDGVPWTLTRDGEVVDRGVAQPAFAGGVAVPGSRGTATITVDHRERGDYVLTVSEPDAAGEPLWTDSKSFVVN